MAPRWNTTCAAVGKSAPHVGWHGFGGLFVIIAASVCWQLPAAASAHSARRSSPTVDYFLSVNPQRPGHFTVRISVPVPTAPSVEFDIPAWTPGYYQILHFETGIDHVRAEDERGHSLHVSHTASRAWTVASDPGSGHRISLTYDVAGSDKGYGFFGSELNLKRETGYINGASALMYVVPLQQSPVTLALSMPDGWQCATTLSKRDASAFTAESYDELIDSPIQLGRFASFGFRVGNIPFQCVLVGDQRANQARIASTLARIAREAIGVFGDAPFRRYTYFFHIGEEGFFGGLEHHDSTVIHLEDPLAEGDDDEFLTTCAHELFHAWNVKHLRPMGLGPFDYAGIVRTPSLWFAEGVTDYYADLIPVRAGLRTPEWFTHQLLQRMQQLDSTPARTRVTLEQASNQAWEGNSEGVDGLSYYTKGSLVAFYLDLRIREITRGSKSLDDLMQGLDRDFGRRNRPYPIDAISVMLSAVASLDLSPEYRSLVAGTSDIGWNTVLPGAGLLLDRQADAFLGVSFVPEASPDEWDQTPDADRPALVQRVEAGFPAERMGLHAGDRIVSIAGRAATYGLAGALIRSLPAGAPVTIVVMRLGVATKVTGETGIQYSHHALKLLPDAQRTTTSRTLLNDLFSSRAQTVADTNAPQEGSRP
jgi:predicted metalloprotease with PDZ domain